MAYTTIDDPSAYFHTQLYTGTGSNQSITNDGNSDLQPDWVWVKDRSAANDHKLTDSNRLSSGNPTITLEANTNGAEYDDADPAATTAFNSDGFTVGTNGNYNTNNNNYVAWQWKANGGTTTSNGASGDIKASVTQREDTAKFAICTYTGTGINAGQSHRVNHGLGTTPHLMLFKSRGASGDWVVYHHKNTSAPETDYLVLNSDAATVDSANKFNDTAPNTSYATIGGDDNISSGTMVLYSFAEVQGYSKFGSYKGNNNTDGTFVYLGFKPAFLVLKRGSAVNHWHLFDNKRDTDNVIQKHHGADYNNSEGSNTSCDFLSNGFKLRTTLVGVNGDGDDYVYMAFAEHPFVSSEGVPVTAR